MVKEEDVEETSTAQADVLAVLANNEDGLSNDDLIKYTSGMDIKARGEAVNALLSLGKIEMFPGHTPGAFILRLRKGRQIADATHEEQLVCKFFNFHQFFTSYVREMKYNTELTVEFI